MVVSGQIQAPAILPLPEKEPPVTTGQEAAEGTQTNLVPLLGIEPIPPGCV
jgi:hypothetical protein